MQTRKRIIFIVTGLLLLFAGALARTPVQPVLAQQIPTLTPLPTPSAADLDETAGGVIDAAEGAAERIASSATGFLDRILQPPTSDTARIILIIGGIILLVAGWAVYDFIILLAGFLIGGLVALSLVNEPNTVLALAVFVVGGLIGAALGALLWFVAVFLIGGYIGIVLTRSLAIALGMTPVSDLALLIGLIVGGVILLALSFQLLIVFSAIVGAQMVALGFGLGGEWVILLAILGIILQIVLTRSRGLSLRRRPRSILWRRRAI